MLVALALASTATAQITPNCQTTPGISLVQGGNTVMVSGWSFKPCHLVTVFLDEVELPCVGGETSLQGSFTAIIVVPNETQLGTHVVKIEDNFGHIATAPITICDYPEKKLCQEYGLPNPDDPFCIATGQPIKIKIVGV